jgi:hypothetical protein
MVANVRDNSPPRGYISSVDALLRIAEARHPDRWHRELLHQKEAEIYSGLGRKYKADFLELELRTRIPQAEMEGNRAIAERFFDFNDAVYDLRTALHAGDLIAEYCDERGEFGWIKSAGWGGDNAHVNLLRGTVELEDGWVRLILFKIDAIDKFSNQPKASAERSSKAKADIRKDLIRPLDGKSNTSTALSYSLEEVFPDGVPAGAPLAHIREKLEDSAIFKTRGLKITKLQNGSYDTTLKRLLNRTKK